MACYKAKQSSSMSGAIHALREVTASPLQVMVRADRPAWQETPVA